MGRVLGSPGRLLLDAIFPSPPHTTSEAPPRTDALCSAPDCTSPRHAPVVAPSPVFAGVNSSHGTAESRKPCQPRRAKDLIPKCTVRRTVKTLRESSPQRGRKTIAHGASHGTASPSVTTASEGRKNLNHPGVLSPVPYGKTPHPAAGASTLSPRPRARICLCGLGPTAHAVGYSLSPLPGLDHSTLLRPVRRA